MADAEAGRTPAHPVWHPHRWPLRWRLTTVLAGLTCVILVVFALVVGRLASNRLHSDFDSELTAGAQAVAAQVHPGSPVPVRIPRLTEKAARAIVRVVFRNGQLVDPLAGTRNAPFLGHARTGISTHRNFEMATVAVPRANLFPGLPMFVQYARGAESTDATIGRL